MTLARVAAGRLAQLRRRRRRLEIVERAGIVAALAFLFAGLASNALSGFDVATTWPGAVLLVATITAAAVNALARYLADRAAAEIERLEADTHEAP